MINPIKNKRIYQNCMLLLFIAGIMIACDKQTVYHAFQTLPQEGWKRKDTLFFHVSVPDLQAHYKLTVEVRNRNDYPYQNLFLSIGCVGPENDWQSADTLQVLLADKEGIWLGDGWSGLYQSAFPVGDIKIGKAGDYLFKIAYTLPDHQLSGINDVGIKIER